MAAGARPAAANTGGGPPGTPSALSPSSWKAGTGCRHSLAARATTRTTRRSRPTSTSFGGSPSRRSLAASPSPARTY
eukprot:7786988-Lingulodinium_polyedra.AAC.1